MGIVLAAGKGSRMKSVLPKVLHRVNDVPMVTRCVSTLEEAGVDEIVVVVGYGGSLVREELGARVRYALQKEQRGTGDAVAAARRLIHQHGGKAMIVYGDNPLLSASTIRRLGNAVTDGAAGSLLAFSVENPPAAGRIIRDGNGKFVKIIEERDCTDFQKTIKEVNAGTYCFESTVLLEALSKLKADNSQGEYYLTDVPGNLVADGHRIEVIPPYDILETLGVNDPEHLAFAESAKDIRYAESMMPLIDAILKTRGA